MRWIWQEAARPRFTWDSEVLLPLLGGARLEQGKLLAQAKSLGFELGQEAAVDILVEEAVRTSEIEGSQLNRDVIVSDHLRIPPGLLACILDRILNPEFLSTLRVCAKVALALRFF